MDLALHAPGPVGITWLLAARELRAKLSSPWFYLVATVVCLLAWLYGAGFQNTFDSEAVLVTTNPLMALDLAVVVFLAVVLGIRLSTALAWEREHRTLEVLLVGPVPWSAVVVAKFVVELCVLALLVAIYGVFLLIAQPLGAGVIAAADAAGLLQMPLYALPTLALGLLVSALARSVRGAVVAFLVIVGLLSVFEIALSVLLGLPTEDLSLATLYVRATLETAAPLVHAVSAVAPLAGLADSLVSQRPMTAGAWQSAVAMTVVMVVAAVFFARLRGAQG